MRPLCFSDLARCLTCPQCTPKRASANAHGFMGSGPGISLLAFVFLVATIFIAVCALDSDFHKVPGSGFIDVTLLSRSRFAWSQSRPPALHIVHDPCRDRRPSHGRDAFSSLDRLTYSKIIYGITLMQINDDRQFTPQLALSNGG